MNNSISTPTHLVAHEPLDRVVRIVHIHQCPRLKFRPHFTRFTPSVHRPGCLALTRSPYIIEAAWRGARSSLNLPASVKQGPQTTHRTATVRTIYRIIACRRNSWLIDLFRFHSPHSLDSHTYNTHKCVRIGECNA